MSEAKQHCVSLSPLPTPVQQYLKHERPLVRDCWLAMPTESDNFRYKKGICDHVTMNQYRSQIFLITLTDKSIYTSVTDRAWLLVIASMIWRYLLSCKDSVRDTRRSKHSTSKKKRLVKENKLTKAKRKIAKSFASSTKKKNDNGDFNVMLPNPLHATKRLQTAAKLVSVEVFFRTCLQVQVFMWTSWLKVAATKFAKTLFLSNRSVE